MVCGGWRIEGNRTNREKSWAVTCGEGLGWGLLLQMFFRFFGKPPRRGGVETVALTRNPKEYSSTSD